jgi:uncharacterized protein involved in type VI secretion and phage assembly
VYPARVEDLVDPEATGRIRVRFLGVRDGSGNPFAAWARVTTLAAGKRHGSWFMPEVGDEVLVAFQAGDLSQPYVLGALWGGQDMLPVGTCADGKNTIKLLRTRSGLEITFDDSPGDESLRLATPGGQVLVLKDSSTSVEINADGSKIIIKPGQIEIESSGKVVLQAAAIELSAVMITANTGMAKFSGVVQVDTLIANSVISSSYSPGAGNIW